MNKPPPLGGQLNIAHREGWAVVEISGPLLWPPAAQLEPRVAAGTPVNGRSR